VAPLDWDRVTWPEFVEKLEGYRDDFSKRADPPYADSLQLLAERPLVERAAGARDIVLQLNRWACRLPREPAVAATSRWLRTHGDELERLHEVRLADERFPEHVPEMVKLYGSVVTLRLGTRTMGDTAASKLLHVLLPDSFVMWDNNIKRFACDYEHYLTEMHRLSRRLIAESGVGAGSIEVELQRLLGYGTRKTLAKYVDEYNWYVAVGEAAVRAG
jgi:hypothetical protein